ncbi:sulfotransferase family protein [Methylobacterium sp. SyP6R]|uniref:sulfotransferase family protein n=1 Tax=Methylobacterium sp. SyP6R TaxID=2718876 RepID=UPI001F1A4483|nr:sulfotransferase [Methylobacterium sp. SyP6R]MCF4124258.1 sulfotransferase [Methylobacterium sp. SyP6R]
MIRSPHSTKGRWVDGTADNTGLAIGLARMFPDARFIGTLGRPTAAVTSRLVSGEAGVDPAAFKDAAEAWERATQCLVEAMRHLGPGRALPVRQGDVTENPARVMRTVLDFCGEPFFRGCEASLARDGTPSPASPRFDDAQSSHLFDLENIYEQVMSGAAMADIRWRTPPVAFDDRCAVEAGRWAGAMPGG